MEGAVAIGAGWLAGSVSLVGFGLDSAIEVSAAVVLTWRLARERRGGCMQASDQLATRAVALSFGLLAIYVIGDGVFDLVTGTRPHPSLLGVGLAAASLVVMPLLARAKRQLAPVLGSQAVLAEAKQTSLCGWLSGRGGGGHRRPRGARSGRHLAGGVADGHLLRLIRRLRLEPRPLAPPPGSRCAIRYGVITPHATRAPEFPAGSVCSSSGSA
jgi:hypothetical protein